MNSLALIQSLALCLYLVQFFSGNPQVTPSRSEIQVRFSGNKAFSEAQWLRAKQVTNWPSLNESTEPGIDPDEVKRGADRIRQFLVD